MGGARDRRHSTPCRSGARRARTRRRPPHRHSHRHQRISKHQRGFARGSRRGAGGATERRRGSHRSAAAAHPACRTVRRASRCLGQNFGRNRRAAESVPRHARQACRLQRPRQLRQELFRGRRHRSGEQRRSPSSLAAAFKASGAALACLCGSDRTYESEAEAAATALKAQGARYVYLAGRPGTKEDTWRAAGLQSFIYEGCDVLATLQAAYDILR